ncbi:pentapeptide repeat-containing protein [Nostoc sp.]|uniref:pentapeptide repeat-containing protein n=1 Tax=Nostoc sp. TaxID=1180 RepID=UPI002FF92517
MSDNNTDPLINWLIVLLFIFILCLFIVFLAFVNVEGLSTEQRLDYGIKALTTTGTIFVGIAVFINAFYAAKRAEAMDKSAKAANKSAEAANKSAEAALRNAEAAQDKQIIERFAKAIEQLGNEKIEVRLGAIYTLERIAKDSTQDHWTIMEVLTAFVRENAPLKKEEKQESPKIRTDIQAALTVIGRRNTENEQEKQRLDLSNIDIRGVDLIKANLERADFISSNFEGALLMQARLQNAEFYNANLRSVVLSEANLQKAYLSGTKLQQANLYKANLQGSFLPGANLHLANLVEANLQGANLSGAKNLEQHQIERAKGDRTTILPENLQLPEHWKAQVSPLDTET